ncbi:penicillin-binding protein [Gleimia sp. 6138-11-ORH1]|uniref:transglycosylase domain-containing protein n=1 Tax=Gleimia sp. 6138-11-ORH1 TaxID=2973937 RepID=UPI0021699EC0|nr:transglycosylase domain-containing protein [Gleimia sp. 6138-11-ORH1]MCS4485150.1 penicillin-binding protein [Gleimia sp. 6138-11-ORH1]
MTEHENTPRRPSGLPRRRDIHGKPAEAPVTEETQAEETVTKAETEAVTERVSLFERQAAAETDAAGTEAAEADPKTPIWAARNTASPQQKEETVAPKKGNKAKQPPAKASWGKRIFKGILLTGVAGFTLSVLVFVFAYITTKVPEPGEFALAQNTTVYYADGETQMGTFGELNRTIIDANTLPKHVGHAVVASEDRSFYTNSGIDLWSIGRAAYNNLKGGPLQGGSTLSQQYVERYYLDTTTGYWGKFKEAILALKINRQQSKEEILGNYLNTIYFGRGAYGIEEASKRYFGHSAAELTISESALLSGIIPAPSAWDPAVSPDIAKQRWERVLNLMVEDGWITAEERSAAVFPEVIEPKESLSFAGPQGYIMQQIRAELVEKAGFTEEEINTGGYKIISTIDKESQEQALRAVAEIPAGHADNLRVALSAVDPRTGEIVAEYAGADYQKLQSNSVTQDYAMAGSTMKPLGLMGYIAAGGTINDVYNANSGIQIKDSRTGVLSPPIRNYANISYGFVNLRFSTSRSANTSFLGMNDAMGPEKTVEAAKRLGLSDNAIGLEANLNNILGSAAVHNIDLTRAYATFASGGVRIDPHIVRQVLDQQGDAVYTASTEGERVYSSEDVSEILPALRDAATGGTGAKASYLGRPVAGKTGTSEDTKSAQFVAFIPQLVTTVSFYQVGPNGEQESITPWNGLNEVTGSSIPGDVWLNFMQGVIHKYEVQDFDWYVPQNRQTKFTKHAYVPPPPKKEEKPEEEPDSKPEKPVEEIKPDPPKETDPALPPEEQVPPPEDPNDKES